MEKLIIIIPIAFVCFSIFSTNAYNFSSIYIFGDSIFDAGNNHYNKYSGAQADFPPYGMTFFHKPTGRFTNGRTVVDFLSEFLQVPLQKPFMEAQIEFINGSEKSYPSNGLNFASAGSGVLNTTNQDLNVTSLQVQVEQFKTLIEQNHIDKKVVQNSLFFFESGSNDIFNYFLPFGTPTLTPDDYVQEMLKQVHYFIDEIYELGANRIAIFSLGPVGCVPARANIPDAPVNKCYGKMNKMVKIYNKGLEDLVNNLPIRYPGVIALYGAVYDTVQIFRATPTKFGFNDVTDACCGYGTLGGLVQCGKESYTICRDPNKYLFFDYFHPSERTYMLLAKTLWVGGLVSIRPINIKALANITHIKVS